MPVKIKNHRKCKEWERRRRDRLNDAFNNLAQLLPHYDPAKIPAKIEILEKSTEFVKELRLSNSRLLSNQAQAENDEKCKLIKELQDEVNKLILRVKQLTILLKKANITIPTGPEIKSLGNKKPKWSGILKPEDAENSEILLSASGSTTKTKSKVPQSNQKNSDPVIEGANSSNLNANSDSSTTTSNDSAKTNPSAPSTSQCLPIIIPLKETNSIKVPPASSTSTVTTNPVITSTSTSVLTNVSPPNLRQTNVSLASLSSSPAKLISAEPIFTTGTTTPIQLPLQTYILTSCPLSGATTAFPTMPQSQFLTRIALPTQIFPKPLEGLSLQKIPIKPVLKPVPKVIWRRKKRSKKGKDPVVAITDADKGSSSKTSVNYSETNSSNKEKDGAVPVETTEEGDILNVVPSSSTFATNNFTPESNEKQTKELATEKVTEDISSQKKSDSSGTSGSISIESLNPASIKDNGGSVVSISNSSDSDKQIEIQISSKEVSPGVVVEETTMESSENIPVLRIIESDANISDEIRKNEHSVIYNVIDKVRDPISSNESTVKAKIVNEAGSKETTVETDVHKNLQVSRNDSESTADGNATPCKNLPNSTTVSQEQEEYAKVTVQSESSGEKETVPMSQSSSENDVSASSSVAPPLTAIASSESSHHVSEQIIPTKEISKEVDNNDTERVARTYRENIPTELPASNPKTPCVSYPQIESEIMKTKSSETEVLKNSSVIENIALSIQESNQIESVSILPSVVPEPVTLFPSSSTVTKESAHGPSSSAKGLSSLQHELMDTGDTVTTTDKISECIARSIDLIDANDSELMELGEHWEDPGGSPKSPISPTQMFLNMFPLLPRESSVSDSHHHHHSQHQPSTSQHAIVATSNPSLNLRTSLPPFAVSSSSRSSFFIDAMLPEDHSNSTGNAPGVEDMGIGSSSHVTPCLALTPPQYTSSSGQQISSPFSLSSSYYWTPAVSSSCSVENAFEYRSTVPANPPNTTSRSTASSGAGATNTSTFTISNTTTTKSMSTFLPVTTSPTTTSTSFATISSIATSSGAVTTASAATTPSKTATHAGKSSKSSKSASVSKQTLVPSSSNSQPQATMAKSTKPAISTVATTNVTWTLSAPTQSVTCYSHHHGSTAPAAAQPTGSQDSHHVPNNQVHFGHHGSAMAASSTTCSLLDSLNPVDASFFRPLINALDAHDFRSLDFSSGTPLPPPPPLPPLIPQVPTKPLYPTQFSSNSVTSQSESIVNFHSSSVGSQEAHITPLQSSLIHHHPVTNIFNKNIQQQTSARSTNQLPTGSPKKQASTTFTGQPSTQKSSSQTPSKQRGSSSSTDKTSKARPKPESSRQSRSGKSSRTQPYYVPTSSGQHNERQESQSNQGGTSQSSSSQTNTQFLIAKSTPNTSVKSVSTTAHFQSYDFQPPNSSTNTGFQMPTSQYATLTPSSSNQITTSSHSQGQISRSSTAEPKSRKNKEEKSKDNSSSPTKSSKSSNQNKHQTSNESTSSTSTSSIQTMNPATHSISQQSLHLSQTTLLQQSVPRPTTQISSKSTPSLDLIENDPNMGHSFQFHTEPFFFPDFTGSGGTRQFPEYTHHPHYSQDVFHEGHSQLLEQSTNNSYPSQRSQPYYLPEMHSFDTFSVPVQPHQPLQVAHQQTSHVSTSVATTLASRQIGSNSASNTSQSTAKYNYGSGSNVRMVNSQGVMSTTEHPGPRHQSQNTSVSSAPSHTSSSTQSVNQSNSNRQLHHQPSVQQESPTYNPNQHQHRVNLPQVSSIPATNISHNHGHSQPQQHQPHSQAQHRHPPSTSIAPSVPLSVAPASNSKSKQSQQQTATLTQTFNQPQLNQNNNQPIRNLQQHPQHQHHQQISIPSQQQSSRSNSRTVNWMTDTGYQTNTSGTGTNAKLRQSAAVGSTSNPFSVSKLVGISSNAAGPPKAQPLSNTNMEQQHPTVAPRSANNTRGKTSTITNTNNPSGSSSSNNNLNSQNQSNYCAEALIRKNPPVNDWNDFSFGTNATFQGYSAHHPQHQHHNPSHSTVNQSVPGADSFPNYGQYPYPPSSSGPSSVTSHFTHFDHSQSQPYHNQNNQQAQGSYHSSSIPQQQSHNQMQHGPIAHNIPQPHSHTSHHQQNSQLQYPNQVHHQHHHQGHGSSSTSSVSNFNLSTIFPEINDKRSNAAAAANNSNVSHGNAGGGRPAISRSSSCGYQQPTFGNQTQTGGGRNAHP